jgi:hypothetical protein
MKAQYLKSKKYTCAESAVRDILDGKAIYWGKKCQNAAWMQNMQLRSIKQAVEHGFLSVAIKKQ